MKYGIVNNLRGCGAAGCYLFVGLISRWRFTQSTRCREKRSFFVYQKVEILFLIDDRCTAIRGDRA